EYRSCNSPTPILQRDLEISSYHAVPKIEWGYKRELRHDPRSLVILERLELAFHCFSAAPGFIPRIVSKYDEQQSKKSSQVEGQVIGVAERCTEPEQWRPERLLAGANSAASAPNHILPTLIYIGVALCFLFGIAFIATGSHFVGAVLVLVGLVLAWL